ncbi:30S ribosomal protein S17 [Chloroflexota bacterium]
MQVNHKIRTGRVISTKMNKTVVVEVVTQKKHPLYKKTVKKMNNMKAHDEKNVCVEGDLVKIEETRPLSREKRWRIAEVLVKAEVVEVKPEEIKD